MATLNVACNSTSGDPLLYLALQLLLRKCFLFAMLLIMQRTYDEVADEVEHITDGLNLPIDAGIKKTVIALRLWDFPTDGSCEGHLDRALPYPWVDIYAPDQEEAAWIQANQQQRERLTKLLDEFYNATHHKHLFAYEDIGIFGGFRLTNKAAKSLKKSEDNLMKLRKDFDVLADFLVGKSQ